jgi:hypothetical protein
MWNQHFTCDPYRINNLEFTPGKLSAALLGGVMRPLRFFSLDPDFGLQFPVRHRNRPGEALVKFRSGW